MNDHLIFGREPGETGDVDVDELKAALAANPDSDGPAIAGCCAAACRPRPS